MRPLFFVLVLFVSLISCENKIDFRDSFLGTYDVTIYAHQSSNGPLVYNDTIKTALNVTKNLEQNLTILFPDSISLLYVDVDTFASKRGLVVKVDKYGKLSKGSIEETPYLYFNGFVRNDSLYFKHTFAPKNLMVSYQINGNR